MMKSSADSRETRSLIASPASPACHPVFTGRASSFMHLQRHVYAAEQHDLSLLCSGNQARVHKGAETPHERTFFSRI
jgi:hypothetical protein